MIRNAGVAQFARFSVIGLINGVVDLAALNILLQIWQTHSWLSLSLINSSAYAVAVLNSYYWNTRFTFRKDAVHSRKEKAAFAVQALISLLVSNGVFLFFVYGFSFLPLPDWLVHNLAKGLSMATSSTSSFFMMKYSVFKSEISTPGS